MKIIKQKIHFNAKPEDVYEYLINPRKLSNITGGKASNTQKVGGKFSAYDDYIQGTNEELVLGKKIVQKWTCSDFPSGHYSKITITFKKIGEKQCDLNFIQEDVPDDLYEDISQGWHEFYWEPIKDYIEDLMWK